MLNICSTYLLCLHRRCPSFSFQQVLEICVIDSQMSHWKWWVVRALSLTCYTTMLYQNILLDMEDTKMCYLRGEIFFIDDGKNAITQLLIHMWLIGVYMYRFLQDYHNFYPEFTYFSNWIQLAKWVTLGWKLCESSVKTFINPHRVHRIS